MQRIATNPSLRRHYMDIMKASLKDNSAMIARSVSRFDKEMRKLDEKELVVNGNFNTLIGIENKYLGDVFKYCKGKKIFVRRNFEDVRRSQQEAYKDLTICKIANKLKESRVLENQYK